jgi:hypothetical protein
MFTAAALPRLRLLEPGRLSSSLGAAWRRRALLLLPPLLPTSPLLPLSAAEQGKGGKPQSGRWVASRGSASGCRYPVKAAQGQRGHYARGLDARAERRRGRVSMAGEAPVGVASKGKGVFPPGRFPGERAGTGSASGPAGQPAVPSGARTGAAGRARTSVEGERGEEERVKGTDRDAPPVVERKRENEPGARWAAVTGWLSWWCWAGC